MTLTFTVSLKHDCVPSKPVCVDYLHTHQDWTCCETLMIAAVSGFVERKDKAKMEMQASWLVNTPCSSTMTNVVRGGGRPSSPPSWLGLEQWSSM